MTRSDYIQHTDKYLGLLEKFMLYLNVYKPNVELPNKANIVIFDTTDKKFSNYSLKMLQKLIKKQEQNIVEVTRTGSKVIPWRISKTI